MLHPASASLLSELFLKGWPDPSKLNNQSRQTALLLQQAKESFAKHLSARPDEIEFLGEVDLGFQLGIQGLLGKESRLVYSAIDRQKVFAVAAAEEKAGRGLNLLPVNNQGEIQESSVSENDLLVWQVANGETGNLQGSPTSKAQIFADCTSSGIDHLPRFEYQSALFGIATEILPVFSRKPIFGYKGLIAATIAIAALSVAVWAHHMYASGQVLLPFFSFMTFLIGVPTGVKFFNWIGTMWRGSVTFETPMLWVMGFLVTFLFGGITGIILASPPLDFAVSASYFVVAHFHYVLFGTVVFAMFAGFYFWWPKFTGRMLDETLGKIHFWTLFFGFHLTFLIQHWMGIKGFPRRYADYLASDGFTFMNMVSTVGSGLLALSMIPFAMNLWITRNSPKVETDDPWGYGSSLEWATSCPPPRHNFTSMPRIRSERPAFDLHYPHMAQKAKH